MIPEDYQYEIVWITKPEHLNQNTELVDSFFELYQDPSNFPDPDELEEPSFIKERIEEGTSDPHTHLMAFLLIEPSGIKRFIAGSVVELYPDSACVLITYIFVEKGYRGLKIGKENKKVGELLIESEHGLAGLVKYFSTAYHKTIKAVLFESNNPFKTDISKDSMPPAKRLKFFSRLGARRIDFDYIQPPLGDDKEIVTNLYLLTFPWLAGLKDTIEIEVVIGFVMELAKSLDRNKEVNSSTRYGYDNYLHDFRTITALKGTKKLNESNPEIIGLTAGNRNILIEMYNNLVANRASNTCVKLTEIPGIDAE